jgi:hypothetical protein
MTKKQKAKKGIDPKLLKYLKQLMDEVMSETTAEGKVAFSLTDKMKVIDRMIGLEKIRLNIMDDGEGSFFSNPAKEEGADE